MYTQNSLRSPVNIGSGISFVQLGEIVYLFDKAIYAMACAGPSNNLKD